MPRRRRRPPRGALRAVQRRTALSAARRGRLTPRRSQWWLGSVWILTADFRGALWAAILSNYFGDHKTFLGNPMKQPDRKVFLGCY